jgi:glyoxylase-like metal-dependent hydrolase (beta-lactamase superfamily II)
LFDLGVRRDWQNYAPKIVSLIKATTVITPGSDVASVLDSDSSGLNIRSADIKAVIWSHNHFDHIGNASTFPTSTELIVGPGVRAASWPGWPRNPDAGVLDSDVQGRAVREITLDKDNNTGLKIGRFDALDFFGDGSFYLLDAPGHAVGHLCALARTTANPPSFVFMGADACHHPGVLRPTDYLPLPCSITPSPFVDGLADSATNAGTDAGVSACPGALLQQLTMGRSPSAPFFTVAQGPLFPDHDAAMDTVRKIQELDAADNVFVLIAHDLSLRDKIPLFLKTINAWKESNLRTETRWLFCNDFEHALHGKNLGEVEGRAADQT